MKVLLRKNTAFTSYLLEHNHKGGDFMLESEMMKHKMVAPKVSISADTYRTTSRGIDKGNWYAIKQKKSYMFQTMMHIEK